MSLEKQYKAVEPEKVIGYLDKTGTYYASEEDALQANVVFDVGVAVTEALKTDPLYSGLPVQLAKSLVKQVIRENKELVTLFIETD